MLNKKAYKLKEVAKRWKTDIEDVLGLAESGLFKICFNWVACEGDQRAHFYLADPKEPYEKFTAGANDLDSMLAC
jgi:hypothetical protein